MRVCVAFATRGARTLWNFARSTSGREDAFPVADPKAGARGGVLVGKSGWILGARFVRFVWQKVMEICFCWRLYVCAFRNLLMKVREGKCGWLTFCATPPARSPGETCPDGKKCYLAPVTLNISPAMLFLRNMTLVYFVSRTDIFVGCN